MKEAEGSAKKNSREEIETQDVEEESLAEEINNAGPSKELKKARVSPKTTEKGTENKDWSDDEIFILIDAWHEF